MQVGRVLGTLVATAKHRKLEGAKLLLVQPTTPDDQPRGAPLLAVDGVGAGIGERVLVVLEGRAAGFFTLAGVIVSAAGLAGMVAFVVARRTREIAIRRAIGAPAANIRRVVISEAVFAAAVGSAVGLLVGGWSSRLLESLLFGVEPADPATLGAAALGMIVLVVGAAVVPAQRALRVSPVDALRTD
jgi:microcompartment protein CcmK/EutM